MIKKVCGNTLYFDGCNTVELAKKYGTPLYVVSETDILEKCQEFRDCFLNKYPNTRVAYASKAFLPLAMARLMDREGMCLDCVSGGEIYTAKMAGFPAERIEFNGNNKSPKEIEEAVAFGVGRIIIDSETELPIIEEICKEKGKIMNVLYRVTPGIAADTHDHMVTGKKDSKFGIDLEPETIFPAIEAAINSQYVNFLGFHFHVGSGIYQNEPYLDSLEIVLDLVKAVKEKYNYDIKELNVGGGFAITFVKNEQRPPYKYFLDPIMERIEKFSADLGIERPSVVIEPGKGIVGEAGITLYTIGSIKEIKNVRKYVAVDGGMTDNIRTELYGAVYEGVVANKMDQPADDLVTICGRCCESGDIVIYDIPIATPERGDIFCVYSTGGYNYSMSSNYNKVVDAPVVLVKEGRDELIVKRQTYDELIQGEIIPDSLK
ncbi:MAG: diaminopimelate decarboxylase [Firmicutes bacterium]|nr:diaminopimelate decarboxylase [Bacillota bacterium]